MQELVVYFDYDTADILPEFNALLRRTASFSRRTRTRSFGSKATPTSAAAASTTSASASAARKPCAAC